MPVGFFKQQEAYDEKARKVLDKAAVDATAKPWEPFYFVAVALFDGSVLVLAVSEVGLA